MTSCVNVRERRNPRTCSSICAARRRLRRTLTTCHRAACGTWDDDEVITSFTSTGNLCLHAHSGTQGLRCLQSGPLPLDSWTRSSGGCPFACWRRVPVSLPLASRITRHPPCLHPTQCSAFEWQGRTVTPRRRARVLPAPEQRRHRRRYPSVQRQASRMGGLLQLPPTAWSSRSANPIRTIPGDLEVFI